MALTFKVKESSLRKVERAVRKRVDDVYLTGALMESATTTIIPRARQNAPVESGALRDSIMVEPNDDKSTAKRTVVTVGHDKRMRRAWMDEIRVPVEYAGTIEVTGEDPNPRPYLRPAVDEGKQEFLMALAASIKRRFRTDRAPLM